MQAPKHAEKRWNDKSPCDKPKRSRWMWAADGAAAGLGALALAILCYTGELTDIAKIQGVREQLKKEREG